MYKEGEEEGRGGKGGKVREMGVIGKGETGE